MQNVSRLEVNASLFDTVQVGLAVSDLEISGQLNGYSKVVIQVNDELQYESGEDTGRVLTLNCPWGTQEMADNILESVKGYMYQPYTASGAVIDPAAEMGDAVLVGGTHGGVYDMSSTFGQEFRADISAPQNEEVDESVPYKSSTDRKIEREALERKAEFNIQAGLISAKVSKSGGDNSSFGWELDEQSWTLKSNGSTVLTANKDGLVISGTVRATGGEIGGFTIGADSLSYNGQTWGGTNTYGAYFGSNGIQLGQNFKVDMQGNLTATNGTFTGTVNAGNIKFGDDAGYLSGGAIASGSVTGSQIAGGTLGTNKFSSGVNTSLGYANFSNKAFNDVKTRVKSLNVSDYIIYGSFQLIPQTINYLDHNGEKKSIRVVRAADYRG